MDRVFEELKKENLVWLPEQGIGYYPVRDFLGIVYDKKYFDKYKGYAQTEIGKSITKSRMEFVAKYFDGVVVDIGIGCGQFVEARKNTLGFDINPFGVEWLKSRNLFADPYKSPFPAATFWDSLEHIQNIQFLLENVREWVFVSIPIFQSCEHVLRSKHFRKDEHCWYFTHKGFLAWMDTQGFSPITVERFEMDLGREDIFTFAFKRKS